MKIIKDKCMSCGQCGDICEYKAAKVEDNKGPGYSAYYIDTNLCHSCLECMDICPGDAIQEND